VRRRYTAAGRGTGLAAPSQISPSTLSRLARRQVSHFRPAGRPGPQPVQQVRERLCQHPGQPPVRRLRIVPCGGIAAIRSVPRLVSVG